MSTDAYRRELLLALRLRDVPGPRIAEVLAEVDSHVAESGENPAEAFGPPREYATQVVNAMHAGARSAGPVGSVLRSLAIALGAGAGGYLLASGLLSLAAGQPDVHGVPALVATLVGLALFGGIMLRQTILARRPEQRVLDPRTGLDMAPEVPAWARVAVVGLPVTLLVVGVVVGLLRR